MFLAACVPPPPPATPTAQATAESFGPAVDVPVGAGEKVLASMPPLIEPATGPIEILLGEAALRGLPITAELRFLTQKTIAIKVTLAGNGAAEVQTVMIRPESIHPRVTFRPRPDGVYRMTATHGDFESHAIVRVVTTPLYDAYRFHVDTSAGTHRLAMRAVIGTGAGDLHRAMWRGANDELTLVDISSEARVIEQLAPPPGGPTLVIGEHTIHVEQTPAGYDARWRSRTEQGEPVAIQVRGERLGDRAILDQMLTRYVPDATATAPTPDPTTTTITTTTTAPPTELYNTAPAGQCSADENHCCIRNDIKIVPLGDCQSGQPGTQRDADGFCEPVECK